MGNVNMSVLGRLEDNYHVQKVKLGEGAFGTVWRGVEKKTNEQVAIKQLNLRSVGAGRSRKDYEHEVSIMRSVNHVNVLQMRAAFEEQGSIWIVLDYADGGDLGDKLKLTTPKAAVAGWMAQVCAAIGAMHKAGIVHRDVKPDNFMICQGVLKLADFGLAQFLPQGGFVAKCGTPAFMAPEQHGLPATGSYGMAVDMWAAGIILYMFLHGGQHPFLKGQQMHMDALMQGKLPKSGSQMACLIPGTSGSSMDAKGLLKALLTADPTKRPLAHEALSHPFLSAQARKRCP